MNERLAEHSWTDIEELRAAGTSERAISEKRYLKSDLELYGCSVWTIRTVPRGELKERHDWNRDALIELVELLWATPVHDRRMAALELLGAQAGSLGPADMKLIERLIRGSKTWALVDSLAEHVVETERPQFTVS